MRNDIREGNLVECEITAIEDQGMVVKLAEGVEGFIPGSEIAEPPPGRRVRHAFRGGPEAYREDPGSPFLRDRSIILSIRQAKRDQERSETRDFMKKQQQSSSTATPTLGDLFGDKLSRVQERLT